VAELGTSEKGQEKKHPDQSKATLSSGQTHCGQQWISGQAEASRFGFQACFYVNVAGICSRMNIIFSVADLRLQGLQGSKKGRWTCSRLQVVDNQPILGTGQCSLFLLRHPPLTSTSTMPISRTIIEQIKRLIPPLDGTLHKGQSGP
jgi:hypothetical protein